MRSAIMVAVFLLAAGRGWAFDTGEEFLKECEAGSLKTFSQMTEEERLLGGACATYFRGFVGGIRVAEAGTATKMICSPAGIEVVQAMRISVKWVKEHAADLSRPAVELIFKSLVDAFPCPQSSPPQNKENPDGRMKL